MLLLGSGMQHTSIQVYMVAKSKCVQSYQGTQLSEIMRNEVHINSQLQKYMCMDYQCGEAVTTTCAVLPV